MDIGSGFGGDDRQRYLRIALIAGVALVVLLLILIVVAIVRGRSSGATATATRPAATAARSPIVASPSASSSARPTVAVTSPSASASASTAPSSAPASASTAPSASASAGGRSLVVANTGGDGVRMRAEPATTAQEVTTLADGALLKEIGPGRNAGGRDWVNVEDENGNRGWVAAEFTAPAP